MIVDTHLHYVELPPAPQQDAPLIEATSVEYIVRIAGAAGVAKVVQVTPSLMGWDNSYSFEGARRFPDRVLGVIGRVDPQSPQVQRDLASFWSQPEALGVRFTMFRGSSVGWLSAGVLEPVLRVAAKIDVPVALFAPGQVQAVHDTVKRHPGVGFLLDHALLYRDPSGSAADAFADWPALLAVASEPNAWTKVSYSPEASHGLEAYPFPNAQRQLQRLYEAVGPDSLVWGSNFPVSGAACSYMESVTFLRDECTFMPLAHRKQILGSNFLRDFARGRGGLLAGTGEPPETTHA